MVYQLPAIVDKVPQAVYGQVSAGLGNQQVITATEITRSGAESLAQLLRDRLGIMYTAGVGDAPVILLRGRPALLLIDGQPLRDISLSAPDLNLLSLNDVAKIIITPGSASVQYGDQAIGGVINIITQQPTKTQATVQAQLGSPLQNQLAGSLSGVKKTIGYRIAASNDYQRGYRDHSRLLLQQGSMSLSHRYASGDIRWQMRADHQNIQYPGDLTLAQMQQDRTKSHQGQGAYQENAWRHAILWQQRFNHNWQLDTHALYQQVWGKMTYVSDPNTMIERSSEWRLNPILKGVLPWLHQAHTQFGLVLSRQAYQFSQSVRNGVRQQYGMYALLTQPLYQRLQLNLGGRVMWIRSEGQFYDKGQYQPATSQINRLWLSTIGLRYQWTQALTSYLRRAQSYQLPFLDQSSKTMTGPRSTFGLSPQTATSYEFGLQWQHNHRWHVNSEWYWMDVKNEIVGEAKPKPIYFANVNLAPTRHIGWLLSTENQITRQFSTGGSIDWQRSWFLSGQYQGKTLPWQPQLTAEVHGRYWFIPHWSWYLQEQYNGSQYTQGDFRHQTTELKAYWLTNVALMYQHKAWQFIARVDNLFNTPYNLDAFYGQFYSSAYADHIAYYPAPGRTLLLQVRYQIG